MALRPGSRNARQPVCDFVELHHIFTKTGSEGNGFRLADQTGILSLRRGGKQVEVFMATLISRHELSG
jgi:hypothetical protein